MQNSKNKIRHVVSLSALVLLFFSASLAIAEVQMPPFSLPAARDGKTISSETFHGKALLITFFATWCPICHHEVPSFIKLQDKFASHGFSVVGISIDTGGASIVKQMMENEGINYPVLISDRITIMNFGGVTGVPESFLVNKEGNVVKRYVGYVPQDLLEKDIQTILL